MDDFRLIYSCETMRAVLYQRDGYTYTLAGHEQRHRADGSFLYAIDADEVCLRIEGSLLFPAESDVTRTGNRAIYYYGD